jgi:hypothetical protein
MKASCIQTASVGLKNPCGSAMSLKQGSNGIEDYCAYCLPEPLLAATKKSRSSRGRARPGWFAHSNHLREIDARRRKPAMPFSWCGSCLGGAKGPVSRRGTRKVRRGFARGWPRPAWWFDATRPLTAARPRASGPGRGRRGARTWRENPRNLSEACCRRYC